VIDDASGSSMVHLLEKALQYSIADRMLQFEEDGPPQSEVADTEVVSSKEVTNTVCDDAGVKICICDDIVVDICVRSTDDTSASASQGVPQGDEEAFAIGNTVCVIREVEDGTKVINDDSILVGVR
jgi:hypothetical protein